MSDVALRLRQNPGFAFAVALFAVVYLLPGDEPEYGLVLDDVGSDNYHYLRVLT